MMFALLPQMLAAEAEALPKLPGRSNDLLTVLVISLAVGLLLLGVFALWSTRRKSRHRHRRHHRQHGAESTTTTTTTAASKPAHEPDDEVDDADEEPGTAHAGHRRRRRRREHRTRNATLAETGGLPPPRPEGQAPPGL